MRRARPAFDSVHAIKIKGRHREIREVVGGNPKKLTGNLKKHLKKVLKQNPDEAKKQLELLGFADPNPYKILGVEPKS